MLEWVLHDGVVKHVRAFAALPTRMRPRVACPGCGEEVRPHLGTVVRYHAAHLSTSTCRLAAGESALHFNLKLHIADALRCCDEQSTLTVEEACATPDCEMREKREWIACWDEVLVEHRISDERGGRVPDIVLRRRGRDIGAIEIRATNKVSVLKEAALARIGVPFVEVLADASLISVEEPWIALRSLPVVRESGRPRWRCARHHTHSEQTVLYAARIVDILSTNGIALRHLFRIEIRYADGAATELMLTCGGDIVARAAIASGSVASRKHAVDEIEEAYARDARTYRDNAGAVVDSPMTWAKGAVARALVNSFEQTRGHRRLTLWSRYPRRYRYLNSRKVWWMPPDLRAVTWNRDRLAAFDEHPAWLQVRESARERYRRDRDQD